MSINCNLFLTLITTVTEEHVAQDHCLSFLLWVWPPVTRYLLFFWNYVGLLAQEHLPTDPESVLRAM